MPETIEICRYCKTALLPSDAYCLHCGATTGQIAWSFSSERRPGEGVVALAPGGSVYLIARNVGAASAAVELETGRLRGLRVLGGVRGQAEPGQWRVFELAHTPGETLNGSITARSDDADPRRRDPAAQRQWWEQRKWREERLSIEGRVRLLADRWLIGSPTVLFPPNVTEQAVRLWNDADTERVFETDVPGGYRVTNGFSTPIDRAPLSVSAGGTTEIRVQRAGPQGDAEWQAGPEREPIVLRRLAVGASDKDADAVIAIDFGTRNTGIRVRWRKGVVASKPRGTVDVIGDRAGNPRFPTEMLLHTRGRTEYYFTDAADRITRNQIAPDEAAIENLKTRLRENEDPYTQYNPRWTNEFLLGKYFERLFARIDDYFETAAPGTSLTRQSLTLRYVLTRPVLDANAGDAQGKTYELALTMALANCGVEAGQISFESEPSAAARGIAKRREKELLSLGEGAAVAVIDSGGGTTDIAIARVSTAEGQLHLDIRGNYPLHLRGDNAAMPALKRYGVEDRLEVGGNVLDTALAYGLLTDATALLDTDSRPIPPRLELSAAPTEPGKLAAGEREFVPICRKMKETFAYAGQQYLNAVFPNRPEYEGIFLEHSFYGDHLLAPVLDPAIEDLREQMEQGAAADGVRAAQIRRVFYVGGTNIDPLVRERFGQAFPLAAMETEAGADVEARIAERLNAVVEGAVWHGESLFATSPLDLTIRLGGEETLLVRAGNVLKPPAKLLPPVVLAPAQELDATLWAAGGGLSEPVCLARGFYRNTSDVTQEGPLQIEISREKGIVATLNINNRQYEQWRIALVGAQP